MIVILTGAPGAGKGTQADLIADREGFKKISTGDALRKHIKDGTEIGKKAQSFMAEGKLVPDSVLLGIIKSELDSAQGKPVLLDGYPRNVAQASQLQEIVGKDAIKAVIHLDVDFGALVNRIAGRRTCVNCGASYHVESSPPKKTDICDRCEGHLMQRPDDQAEKVKTRLTVYENETRPILDFYKKLDLYQKVDGNRSTEAVYKELSEKLKALTSK